MRDLFSAELVAVATRLAADPTVAFMVVRTPTFLCVGKPYVIAQHKLVSGTLEDTAEEILGKAREANQRNHYLALLSVGLTEVFSRRLRYYARYVEIPMESAEQLEKEQERRSELEKKGHVLPETSLRVPMPKVKE